MKKVFITMTAICIVAILNSCGEKAMDPAAVQAKVDSMAAIKIDAMSATAIADCEMRMATEVKAKTDSLVHVAQMANAAL